MDNPQQSNKTPIIVAIIGLIGVLGAAVIANSEKLFPAPNKATSTAASSPGPSQVPGATGSTNAPHSSPVPTLEPNREHFLGAMDGTYRSSSKDDLDVNWDQRSFSLTHFNCSLMGKIVEHEGYWAIVVEETDGLCELIDKDDYRKEVGKIIPQKGAIMNSGRVARALVNFDKASLRELSGVYELQ